MIELVVLLFSLGVVLALFRPLLGLYAFFIIAYIRPQDFYPFLANVEPAKWILIITFVSFILRKLNSKEKFVKARQNWALLGVLLAIFISRFKAIDTVSWWRGTEDFIVVCMVYFLMINMLNAKDKLRNFYIFFVAINLLIALRFLIAYKTGTAAYWGNRPGDLSYGFMANADDLGLGMAVAFAYAVMSIFYAKNLFLKGLASITSGAFMLAALVTGSRGAQIGIFTVFLVSIVSQLKREKLKRNYVSLGMVIVLLMLALFTYKYRYTLRDSYASVHNKEDSGRIGRMATWTVAKQMIKENPLIGVGRGNYVEYWREHYPPGVYGYQVAHNIIYEVTAEIGLIGLAFFLYFSLIGLKDLRTINKRYKDRLGENPLLEMLFTIYFVGVIAFYVNGMFITVAFYWHIYVLTAMFVCAKNVFMKEVEYEKAVVKKQQA